MYSSVGVGCGWSVGVGGGVSAVYGSSRDEGLAEGGGRTSLSSLSGFGAFCRVGEGLSYGGGGGGGGELALHFGDGISSSDDTTTILSS